MTGNSIRDYQKQWDNYWKSVQDTGMDGQVLWDVVPEMAVEQDLDLCQKYMDAELPLIDLGCGNGRQTRFLAGRFKRVIGADISKNAIDHATRETGDDARIDYRVLDVLDDEAVQRLHDEFGDMNVYMRSVLHQIQKPDRLAFLSGLAVLMGKNGRLYQIELMAEAIGFFKQFPGDSPSGLPSLLHRVVEHGIHPAGFKPDDILELYPEKEWEILKRHDNVRFNTILVDEEKGWVPAICLVAKRV